MYVCIVYQTLLKVYQLKTHWSVLAVGSMYDVISNKSNFAI